MDYSNYQNERMPKSKYPSLSEFLGDRIRKYEKKYSGLEIKYNSENKEIISINKINQNYGDNKKRLKNLVNALATFYSLDNHKFYIGFYRSGWVDIWYEPIVYFYGERSCSYFVDHDNIVIFGTGNIEVRMWKKGVMGIKEIKSNSILILSDD